MANTNIHAEWWRTDAQVGRDGFCRTIYAPSGFARELYGNFEHYAPSRLTSTTTYPGFDVDVLVAGTLVMADRVGGWLYLTGGGAATQGIQMQEEGCSYLPAAGLDIWFEAEIELNDADDIDWLVGLAEDDDDIWTADPTEIIAFRGDDGDLNIDFQVRDGGAGAQADTGVDVANTTAIRLGFWVQGITQVVPYINGTAYTAVTANIPTSVVGVSFGMRDGATQANNTLRINWYRVLQLRT